MHQFEFNGKRDKRLTLGLMGTMFLTSFLDMVLDWVNLNHMESPQFKHGLVVGPPTQTALTALLVINIIGTILFFVEITNAAWLISKSRRALVPLVFEQFLVLLAEEIPMAIINLSIVNCRIHYATASQIACGFFGLLNVGIRLYAYGWYREVEHKTKDSSMLKTTIRLAVYITVSMLWLILCVTAFFTWQSPSLLFAPSDLSPTKVAPAWMKEPSIVLLNTWKWERAEDFRMDLYIDRQGMDPHAAWLVPNLEFIREGSIIADYPCKQVRSKPMACSGLDAIRFRFQYAKPITERPFGSLYYNIAGIKDKDCLPMNTTLHQDWTLAFLKIRVNRSWSGRNVTVLAKAPWDKVCSVPIPGFDNDIDVCF